MAARKNDRKGGALPETWTPGRISRRDTAAALVLALLAGVSYFPSVRLGFVWDDTIITTLNAIRDWSGIGGLWFAPVSAYRQGSVGEYHYWPLLYSTFWLEHKLWGFAPAGYHAVNIALHFVNTALLWRLLLRLQAPGAWWVAAVFAVHPVHVEAVTWVIARKDLLSTLFYLAAFMSWVRFNGAPRLRGYAVVSALFAAALLCKSIAVSLPAALLLWHWWKQGRVTATDLRRVAPLVLVGLVLTAIDMVIYQRVNLSFDYSMVQRTLIAAHALWFYAGKLLWPVNLALLYPHWDVTATSVAAWGYLIAAAGMFASLWFLRHRISRGPLACALFFALTLSPVLGFLDYGYMNISFAADRYQYLAGAGVLTLVIGAAAHGARRLRAPLQKALAGAAGVVLVLLGTATWHQTGIYKDDATLFSHSAAVNSGSWGAHLYAGTAFFDLGRYDDAEKYLRRALELRTWDESSTTRRDILQNIAESLRRRARYQEALGPYRAVIESHPRFALAHAGLGAALSGLRRYDEAVKALERALSLKLDPSTSAELQRLLGGALGQLALSELKEQRYGEVLRIYRRMLELHPDNARTHHNMGVALYRMGRLDEALRSFRRALALKPDLAVARKGLEQVRKRLRPSGP